MLRNDQQPTCLKKTDTNDQTLPLGVPPMVGQQKKNIQGNLNTLLGRDCVMEKVMRFLNDKEIFEEIMNIRNT